MREPSVFWAVPGKFVAVDGLSIHVLPRPQCAAFSVAADVMKGGTVDNSVDILAPCDNSSRWPSYVNVGVGFRWRQNRAIILVKLRIRQPSPQTGCESSEGQLRNV